MNAEEERKKETKMQTLHHRRGRRQLRKSVCIMPIPFFSKISLLVILLLQLCSECKGDFNPPFLAPVLFRLNNNFWRIHEDEHVGAEIADLRPMRESGSTNITYSIEGHHLGDDISEHFEIKNRGRGFGKVILKKSFQGQVGKEALVSVVGVTSETSARTRLEARVRIEGPIGSPEEPNPKPPKILQPNLPPPGSITPSPPPDLGDNNNFPDGPYSPSLSSTVSTSNVPQSTSSRGSSSTSPSVSEEAEGKSQETTSPQDILPPAFQPHFPSNNTISNVDSGKQSSTSSTFSPAYNVSSSSGNDPHLTYPVDQDKKDYSEIPDNELGESAVVAKIARGNRTGIGHGIPHQKGNGDGDGGDANMALYTTIPILVILGIVIIIIYLVNKRNKIKKRPVKEARKESAVTISSNNTLSGEGEPPTALQQWVGKRAQSNRYESWAPDAVPTQARDRWEFPRHHLQIGGILGEGCFGQVWRCEALNIDGKEGTSTVAVKTLKESAGDRERQDLLSELTVMKMLDPHPNVVRLLGCCTDKDPVFVIMEYVPLGKLQTYLRNSRAQHYYGNLHGDSTSLSSKDLTSFCYQVARGMEYLSSKGIIHRDLAARNILIDKERVCKVADFGFARDIVDNHVYERKSDGRLPIRWMAPEALYDNLFTTKTDVWSFGVLMWEIVTLGSTPYPGLAAGDVMRKVRDGYRLEKPEHCKRELYNIMFYCWAHNPDDRPSFSDLVNFLSHLLFSETDYIELHRFPDHDYYNMASLSGEKL